MYRRIACVFAATTGCAASVDLVSDGPCSRAPALVDTSYAVALGVTAMFPAIALARDTPAGRHDDDDGSWIRFAKYAVPVLIAGSLAFALSARSGFATARSC